MKYYNLAMDIYFKKLQQLIKNAYAPYSKFNVAAIVSTDIGEFNGVNIENSSYSATVCAERVAIFNAIANGAKKFNTLYLLTSSNKDNIVPCGMCLQVMSEFFDMNTKIIVSNKLGKSKNYTLKQLLPKAFKLEK
jgi:cytidine deaminase